jgi:hypothetical protein
VPAIAVDLCDIARPFAVGAAIFSVIINSTIAGRILTRPHVLFVSHLALPSSENLLLVNRMLLYLNQQLVNKSVRESHESALAHMLFGLKASPPASII